ncbi:metal ABC transporter ATP-binding protein [Ilumatobacter nonamiensis]|uniref:metal ABC transporter ATP-binding protein n=1 Tax=Ilumatobacter nonamiensis TaxID=467093 RepID=UPI00034C82EF|nr:metal ABC transporter ATP-binding protein [Ilumatobacter nonamiensis]
MNTTDTERLAVDIDDLDVDRGGNSVLRIDQVRIEPGYTAVVGPNGSGKSTLLHVISGLISPRRGTVLIGGEPPRLGSRVAYVLQSQHASRHLLVTAREVVALAQPSRRRLRRASARDRRRVDDVLELLGVADLANRQLADMSGGQRQRVFIAQGLAQDAEIILLDEPVAGLDLASSQLIRHAIDEQRDSGRVVVVATHDLDEAARADRVLMLNTDLIAAGSPSDVLVARNLRRAYQGRVLDLGDGSITVDDAHHH